MKSIACILSLILTSEIIGAQSACTAPEFSQFDFWLGEWELTWNDTSQGSNIITKDMNGCVVYEHFNDPESNFRGMSWSVYNPNKGQWQQTWVDNTGGYIVLTGTQVGDKVVLTTPERKTNEGSIINHMIFYNITADAFDWNWEASTDKGKTWDVKWKIHYRRKY